MRNKIKKMASCLSLLLLLSACTSLRQHTVHDEILTYEEPFDKAYLQILEVGGNLPGWVLEFTSKPEGLIMMRKKKAVNQVIVLVVKNLDKRLVSVELSKESQMIDGVGDILREIDASFLRGAARKKAPSADEEAVASQVVAEAQAEAEAPVAAATPNPNPA